MVSPYRLAAVLASLYCCAQGLATSAQSKQLTVVDPGKREALQDLVRLNVLATLTRVLTSFL